jgi:hypothetical protein
MAFNAGSGRVGTKYPADSEKFRGENKEIGFRAFWQECFESAVPGLEGHGLS